MTDSTPPGATTTRTTPRTTTPRPTPRTTTPTEAAAADPATDVVITEGVPGERVATPRHFLMCRPTHFDVVYEINPWMDASVAVDRGLVMSQWESLRQAYLDYGHRVDVIEGAPGLPDMVYAANGATVVGGRSLGAKFRHPQRRAEAALYTAWLRENGFPVTDAVAINEGEGDFLAVGDRILAASGFRADPAAHAELAAATGREVVSVELVDPRFYHVDTALAVLDDDNVAYLPEAFSPASQALLAELYPRAIHVSLPDALVFGLNSVSDGRHVFIAAQASAMAEQLRQAGYEPVPVDLSELLKGGGGIKCCTMELRPAASRVPAPAQAPAQGS